MNGQQGWESREDLSSTTVEEAERFARGSYRDLGGSAPSRSQAENDRRMDEDDERWGR